MEKHKRLWNCDKMISEFSEMQTCICFEIIGRNTSTKAECVGCPLLHHLFSHRIETNILFAKNSKILMK